MTHTKEDYQAAVVNFNRALEKLDKLDNAENRTITGLYIVNRELFFIRNIIRAALQLAIDLQPRPIEEAPRDKSVLGCWENCERLAVVKYDTDMSEGRMRAGLSHWIEFYTTEVLSGNKQRIVKNYCSISPTHFYDLSALPRPLEGLLTQGSTKPGDE